MITFDVFKYNHMKSLNETKYQVRSRTLYVAKSSFSISKHTKGDVSVIIIKSPNDLNFQLLNTTTFGIEKIKRPVIACEKIASV